MKHQHRSEKEKGMIALFLLALIFGMLPLMLRYLGTTFELFSQLYMRMFLGVLFTWLIFRKQISFKKIRNLSQKEFGWIFLRSALYFLCGVGLYNYAVLITKISNVVLIETIPMTAIFSFIMLREKITSAKIVSILLTCLGVFIISFKNFEGGLHFGVGELLTLASTIFITLGLISRKMMSTKLNDYETGLLMLLFAGIQFIMAALIVRAPFPITGWTWPFLIVLIIGGFLNAGITVLMNYGFARVEAVVSGNILTLQTLFAIILAFFFFHEVPLPKEILGGILILSGVLFLQYIDAQETKKQKKV